MEFLRSFQGKIARTHLYWKIFNNARKLGIKNFSINEDGSIDVNGDVNLNGKNLKEIPIKFNKVNGDFVISNNYHLRSLVNCPIEVTGVFDCSHCLMESIHDCPTKSVGHFNCRLNKLKSLVGSPKSNGYFICSNNNLKSFVGIQNEVYGLLDCKNNNLKTFEGFPELVVSLNIINNFVDEIYCMNPCFDFIEMLNEYGVINKNGREVSLMRLNQAFEDSGGKRNGRWPVRKPSLKYYKLV